ncbi:TrmH family RNA methyltransferase [Flavobacterium sp. GNP001]
MKQITSIQNPYIKSLVQLQEKAKARKQSGTFLIEGKREISIAIKGGYQIETLLFLPEICSENEARQLYKNAELIEINKEVYQKLAYRDTTEGILAVAKTKSMKLSDLKLSENPLILIAEAPEKPGNIGALLRTADAANLDAVIIANPKSDLYNPNTVRSQRGLFIHQPNCNRNHIRDYCVFERKKNQFLLCDFTKLHFLSHAGLHDANRFSCRNGSHWINRRMAKRSNPKYYYSNAGRDRFNECFGWARPSILIFEAKRQRGF